MLYVTRNNYSHFVRDLIWRSVIRDWGGEGDYEQANTNRRPVRLEQWMIAFKLETSSLIGIISGNNCRAQRILSRRGAVFILFLSSSLHDRRVCLFL